MTPVRALHVTPPLIMIVERNFVVSRRENDCTCHEIFLGRSRELLFCWCAFSNGHILRGADEFLELRIGDWRRVDPERIYIYAMHRLRVIRSHRHRMTSFAAYRRAHGKFASRNPDHRFRRFAWRRFFVRNSWLEVSCVGKS